MLDRKFAIIALLLLPAAAVAAAVPATEPTVTVDRRPPTSHTRTFDPKAPPADVHLTGNEAAYTGSAFRCAANVTYRVVSKTADGSRSGATIQIGSVKVELALEDTLHLPKNATKKLVAHEEGHRQIDEMIYNADAESAARRLAASLVGRTFTAAGSDPDAAASVACKSAMQKLCDDYMLAVSARASTVNDVFDKVTDHGRNKVAEADAIRQSFQKVDGGGTKR